MSGLTLVTVTCGMPAPARFGFLPDDYLLAGARVELANLLTPPFAGDFGDHPEEFERAGVVARPDALALVFIPVVTFAVRPEDVAADCSARVRPSRLVVISQTVHKTLPRTARARHSRRCKLSS